MAEVRESPVFTVLERAEAPENALQLLAEEVSRLTRSAGVWVFAGSPGDSGEELIPLGAEGGSCPPEGRELAALSLMKADDLSRGVFTASVLSAGGVPFGVLVLEEPLARGGRSFDALRALAGLLAFAGGPARRPVLPLTPFLGELRRERERGLRTGRGFAVIEVTVEADGAFGSNAVAQLRGWVRRSDTVAVEGRTAFVLLPEAGPTEARVAAYRLRDLIVEAFGTAPQIRFAAWDPDRPVVLGVERAGTRTRIVMEGTQWSSVPAAC